MKKTGYIIDILGFKNAGFPRLRKHRSEAAESVANERLNIINLGQKKPFEG
ncbi:MAG: hypothetical protein LBH20_03170 [Treponema sp.]|jgi:hypothetical protein|nr:hypothetical protein [Treponema sp.]